MAVSEQEIPAGAATAPAGDRPPKRGRGRPKGSKNKPKSPVDQVAAEQAGNGDNPPNKGERKKRISKKVTQQIEDALAEIFCAPAMGTAIIGDEWATQHFTTTGRELAHRIAVTSERHSQLRAWCEKALDSESVLVLGLAITAYAVPPLIHWNIIPGPDNLLGVPRRPTRQRPHPPGESPSAATEWADDGETAQQTYEREMREKHAEAAAAAAANGNGAGEPQPMYAEFSDDDQTEPPTFIESPVG